MTDPAFDLHRPASPRSCVIFASPHSGRDYTPDFLARSVLDPLTLRSSEDAFVDRLFAPATDFGATLIAARAPRAWIDFNRAAEELDPALIEGVSRTPPSPRISAGLGVVPRVVANGRAIYRGKLSRVKADARVATAWAPYHGALRDAMERTRARFGRTILIDCHSMPHEALEGAVRGSGPRPQVVLGDRFGTAASGDVVERIEAAFAATGLRVARNAPFAGAYVAEHYGRPAQGWHVVQVEIDRALYMDERRVVPNAHYGVLQRLLRRVIAEIAAIDRDAGRDGLPLAAE
jgi:N-formylglutamate deformylase